MSFRVIYEVEEIRGSCPLYDIGDKIVMDSKHYTEVINLEESNAVCLRVLDNTWNDLMYQVGDDDLVGYVAGGTGECRVACSMPGEPYTPCGYVIFRVNREKLESGGKNNE